MQSVADAAKLADAGVDGIVLSNHGGRQLDRAPVPFHLLPAVRKELGDQACVMVDTGIMNGADVVAAMALGASFTLIGRAYLYGLMAGGRQGVDRTIAILQTEIVRTMRLLGVTPSPSWNPGTSPSCTACCPAADPPGADPHPRGAGPRRKFS